jgi:hypothetical protein
MSEIKYEDIYFMLKDVAYDQVDPIEAYKEIEKEIIKVEAERDKYKAQRDALIECINITLIGLSKPDNGQIKIRVFDVLVAALNKIKEG